jgi:hypothetical protein
MKVEINNKDYFTNISDNEVLDKCKDFFSKGCTSYAITSVDAKYHICNTREKGYNVIMVKDFNNGFKFVPFWAKDIEEVNSILQKGLNIIEL